MSETNLNAKTVLIAEDSAVTQDILSLVLSQRDHKVTLADNGQTALDHLNSTAFDLVLMDYHLPDMKGLEVATQYLKGKDGQEVPTLIAMTGDPKALLSSENDCEIFDKILTKPIEMEDVIPVIEAEDSIRKIHQPIITRQPTPKIEVAELPFKSLELDLLYLPLDIADDQAKRQTANRLNLRGCPDAVVILEPMNQNQLDYVARLAPAHLAPVIDLGSTLEHRADLSGARASIPDETVTMLAREFALLREDIHADLLRPKNDEEALIGSVYVRGGVLQPKYSASNRSAILYNNLNDPEDAEGIAERLVKQGILSSKYFDRLFSCGSCNSSRLLVREECPKCRDSKLYEEYYLHHFRCAYQGPESQFKHGDQLVCPKCRRELTHYGVNYNKPGLQHICRNCGHSTTDPAVGFLCLDCESHTDGDKIRHVERLEYEITDFGREFMSAGRMLLGGSTRNFRFSDLPFDFSIKLNGAAKRYMDSGASFSLISVGYSNLAALTRQYGEAETSRNREMLCDLLKEALPSMEAMASSKSGEYFLLSGTSEAEAQSLLDLSLSRLGKQIKIPLEPLTTIYGPEQLS